MSTQGPAGIYIIRCTATQACYVGQAKRLFARLRDHRYKLFTGRHSIPLLQRDWNRYGEKQFEFHYLPLKSGRVFAWEEFMIMLTDALEISGGYNRMLGQEWSTSVRIRDTERKLIRSRKFRYLPTTWPEERLHEDYWRTFCQRNTPIASDNRSRPIVPQSTLADPMLKTVLQKLLTGEFRRFEPEEKQCRPAPVRIGVKPAKLLPHT